MAFGRNLAIGCIMALGRNKLIELDLAFCRNLAYGHNMAVGHNELIELDLAFGRLAYGRNMAVGHNELIKLILVAIGRIDLIIEFNLGQVCSFGSASFFVWPSSTRLLQMTKYCVMRECENILNGYIYVCDYIFSHQDGIYGFKFPSRFLGISRRDLTSFSLS